MRQRIFNWVRDHHVISIAAIGIVIAFIVIFVWAAAFRGNGDGKDKLVSGEPGGAGAPEYTTSIVGRVLNTAGDPISGALIRVSGPFRSTEGATNYEALTNEAGKFKIKLPIDGEYDILALADGYEPSALVSGQDIEEVIGDFAVDDIVLKKRQEVVPQRGSAGFVYGEGILDEEGVYRVLMLHGIISSRDEVVDIFEDSMTGQGWSTFVRDGQTISVRPIIYNNEPAWHVVLQPGRSDGLTDVFVQKACGNISAPLGEKPPMREEVMPPPPGPVPAPVPTPPPPVTPPPTPPGATPTPPTVTPTPTPTPTPPTRTPTPTPQPPLFIPGCGEWHEHHQDANQLFWRQAEFTSNLPVRDWLVSSNLGSAFKASSYDDPFGPPGNRQHALVQAREGDTVTVRVLLKDGRNLPICTSTVPVSQQGATPAPTRTPAPVPTPGPDPEPTPHWTPPPPP